jgi:hypothetical protein
MLASGLSFWFHKFSDWAITLAAIYIMPNCCPIPRRRNLIPQPQNYLIPLLILYIPQLAWWNPQHGSPYCSSRPPHILLMSPCVKKILDFWMISLMQTVPLCPFLYFLNPFLFIRGLSCPSSIQASCFEEFSLWTILVDFLAD